MTTTTLTAAANSTPTDYRRQPRSSTRRWTAARTAVRRWFAATQLGPVNNYVTR